MDGHSHHDHKKRDLQVSKRGSCFVQKGNGVNQRGKQGGVNLGDSTVNVFMHAYLFRTCYLK